MLVYACSIVMVACLLLGGSTRAGYLADVVLQLSALPLLLIAVWRLIGDKVQRSFAVALLFCVALMLVHLLQLVPLPPRLWTALPGREELVSSYLLLGAELPWLPISLTPDATWFGMLSLLPPLALFLAVAQFSFAERRALSLLVLAVGIASAFLGLMQVAQGPESPLRFFEVTNPSEAVGFFANRNHFSALLYCLLLIAAAWTTNVAAVVSSAHHRKAYDTTALIVLILGFTALVVLIGGQLIARSRAGLILTIIALIGAGLLAVAGERRTTSKFAPSRLIAGATILAVVFATQFALYRFLDRFQGDPLADARLVFSRNTMEAAYAYMPFGAGVGSFVTVYHLFEKPADLIATYANRAHNDILELWLETGLAGLVLMGVFGFWLLQRTLAIWRRPFAQAEAIDQSLARAATIIVGLLLAHSVVDYPLRTGAMVAVLAFACALLIPPPASALSRQSDDALERPQRRVGEDRMPRRTAPGGAVADVAPPSVPAAGWGADIEWPEEWRPRSPSPSGEFQKKPTRQDEPDG